MRIYVQKEKSRHFITCNEEGKKKMGFKSRGGVVGRSFDEKAISCAARGILWAIGKGGKGGK